MMLPVFLAIFYVIQLWVKAGLALLQRARERTPRRSDLRRITRYVRLMHRWFVFSRILVQNESFLHQALLVLSYGLHPLVLAGLFVSVVIHPATGIWPLMGVLIVRATTLAALNRRFTGAWRHAPLASVIAELLQPVFLAGAFLRPVIWWRHRKIRVHQFNNFEYLPP